MDICKLVVILPNWGLFIHCKNIDCKMSGFSNLNCLKSGFYGLFTFLREFGKKVSICFRSLNPKTLLSLNLNTLMNS